MDEFGPKEWGGELTDRDTHRRFTYQWSGNHPNRNKDAENWEIGLSENKLIEKEVYYVRF
jgi:hypothetical protein